MSPHPDVQTLPSFVMTYQRVPLSRFRYCYDFTPRANRINDCWINRECITTSTVLHETLWNASAGARLKRQEIPFLMDAPPRAASLENSVIMLVSCFFCCFFSGGKFEAANKAISLLCRSVHISEWQRYVFSLSLSLFDSLMSRLKFKLDRCFLKPTQKIGLKR